ncbi:unnamed protein product, partial [marine sediment metagenome]
MSLRMLRITIIITIFLFSICVFLPVLSRCSIQDEDAKDYKQAYNLILEEKWEEASKTMTQFIQKYSRSTWVDDARFWQCYTKEKLDHPL